MPFRIAFIAALTLALLPASAPAQVTSAAAPNTANAASHLKLAVDGTAPPFASRVPKALVLSLDAGFQVDTDVAMLCSDSAGAGGGCPPGSQMASGTAVAETSFLGGPASDVTATIEVFRSQTAPAGALAGLIAVIDAQGNRSSFRGAVRKVDEAPFGYEVRFDDLVLPQAPFGTSVRLKRFDVDISATRRETVTVKRSVRCKRSSKSRSCKRRSTCKRGRKCPRYRVVRQTRIVERHLLRNPQSCNGSWASRTVATFDDGSSATVDAPIACSD